MTNQIKFYPYNAINEFMRPDFRLSVIRDVLSNVDKLPPELASDLAHLTRKSIKIPGFRNSEKAPSLVKVMPMAKEFEKHPEVTAVILSAWAALNSELALQVHTLLKNRNWSFIDVEKDIPFTSISSEIMEKWPILPPEMNRTRAPGFLPRWPKGEDFETLYSAYTELYPEGEASIDKVSLMAVWITLRLPYTLEETSEPQNE